MKLGIIVGEFNRTLTERMVNSAKSTAQELGAQVEKVVWVPGCYDIPYAIMKLIKEKEVDAIVMLAAVKKGSTDHDQVITYTTAYLAAKYSSQYGIPITNGIIGPGATMQQCEERAEEYGKRATEAAVKLLKI